RRPPSRAALSDAAFTRQRVAVQPPRPGPLLPLGRGPLRSVRSQRALSSAVSPRSRRARQVPRAVGVFEAPALPVARRGELCELRPLAIFAALAFHHGRACGRAPLVRLGMPTAGGEARTLARLPLGLFLA